jgi:4-hydroxy-4-methyl-2-oxoglutarate aldolase
MVYSLHCVWLVYTAYQTFGSMGLITSGAGRDLDQVHKIGYPVFTGGTISAHRYCTAPFVHVPVGGFWKRSIGCYC